VEKPVLPLSRSKVVQKLRRRLDAGKQKIPVSVRILHDSRQGIFFDFGALRLGRLANCDFRGWRAKGTDFWKIE
jgi:hypothetical protein